VAFVGGGLVGLALLVARLTRRPLATRLVGGYVQLFQGTPLLMQLFLAYFGLAALGLDVPAWFAAALALTRAPVQMAESHNVANDAVRSTPAAP
jgi:polar amino acid transport system permease protein